MIRKIEEQDIPECVQIIKKSFLTVANQFGFTMNNAPRFTAFAMTEDRLLHQLKNEQRPMYGACNQAGKIVGYYSLLKQNNEMCELNNLCVLPAYRHKRMGTKLLEHAYCEAKKAGCTQMNIGIVEENLVLKTWYEKNGFIHTGTRKFDFFPFTCGYMEKNL